MGAQLILLCAALLAAAQTSERITVEVVNVPVYVTKDYAPVRGLGRDAFELFVNGKRQPIDYFDVVDFGPAASPRERADTLRDRRLFLLVFDLAFTRPPITLRAARAAEAFIDRALPSDLFAVATLTGRDGLRFDIPFTSDRALVHRALRKLRPDQNHDPLGLLMSAADRAVWSELGDSSSQIASGKRQGPGATAAEAMASAEAPPDLQDQQVKNLMDNDILQLAEAADRLAPLDGYKHVVVFSEGFSGSYVHGVGSRGTTRPIEPRLIDDFQKLHRHYQAAGVFLDTIDVAGLRHTLEPFENDSLLMLALDTGGQFVHNRNDLAAALTDLADAQQVVYLLGFKPGSTNKRMNTIDVRVKGAPRGSSVSFRRGFATSLPEAPVDSLQLADVVMNDVPQTGVAATLTPRPNGVTVDVPKAGAATLMLYVFDAKGEIVDYREKAIGDAVRYDESFDLPPGEYVAKALLRAGKTLGLSRASFTVRRD
jgi:VWFA-related protein